MTTRFPRLLAGPLAGELTADELMDATKAVAAILSVPVSAAGRADAIAVPTGQGEDWRLAHAIGIWESNPEIRHMLLAEGNPAERTYRPITPEQLRSLGLRREAGTVIQDGPGPNTAVQMEWIADQVEALGLSSVALCVTPYHLPRAYLTLLKTLISRGIRMPLLPMPVALDPAAPMPETNAAFYDLLPGELLRIHRYQEHGWVATLNELRIYLKWLWDRHQSLVTP